MPSTTDQLLLLYPDIRKLGGWLWRWYVRRRWLAALRDLGHAADDAKAKLDELEARYPFLR